MLAGRLMTVRCSICKTDVRNRAAERFWIRVDADGSVVRASMPHDWARPPIEALAPADSRVVVCSEGCLAELAKKRPRAAAAHFGDDSPQTR